ncbi:MAG TPA: 1-acyl-sn-glycerol-3-phosphate acyltransferase [Sphaerochaeta sp.]|nr:1-acyl-sn-glycerol-3-phosphate acyltransferase [Sphaerochaeta sp.]
MSKTPLFIRISRPTYGRYLLWSNNIQTEGMEILTHMQEPFLILGNHSQVYDAFFVSSAAKVHIRWIAGAVLFKLFGLKLLLGGWVGAIAKQQGRSDLHTIRAISKALKEGDNVGLFPEGTRTWDGESVGFDRSTAKLIKILKVPVIILSLEGIYATKPRWADKKRVGSPLLRVLPPLSREAIAEMTKDELYTYLVEHLSFSYRAWQEKTHIPFLGKAQAEGLQRVLYLCPDCLSYSTLQTKKDLISCTKCNMVSHLDAYDQFTTVQGNNPFKDVPQWHEWEQQQLLIHLQTANPDAPIFPPDKGILFQRGKDDKLFTLSKDFSLSSTREGLQVVSPDPVLFSVLPFSKMQSMVINAKNTIEFYHDDKLYRIRIERDGSSLKYVELFHLYAKKENL